jgi:hypothetical protein
MRSNSSDASDSPLIKKEIAIFKPNEIIAANKTEYIGFRSSFCFFLSLQLQERHLKNSECILEGLIPLEASATLLIANRLEVEETTNERFLSLSSVSAIFGLPRIFSNVRDKVIRSNLPLVSVYRYRHENKHAEATRNCIGTFTVRTNTFSSHPSEGMPVTFRNVSNIGREDKGN